MRERQIRERGLGFDEQRMVCALLRPRLRVSKPLVDSEMLAHVEESEGLHHLVRVEFEPAESPAPEEIFASCPNSVDSDSQLFTVLFRTVTEALEEAADAGLVSRFDRSSHNVPSIAVHPQNEHHRGFYPITRMLADLWVRVAGNDAARAREFLERCRYSRFRLLRRLWLFGLTQPCYSAEEAGHCLVSLDDDTFWGSDSRVEVMRLMISRWHEFSDEARSSIEQRLREGISRSHFPDTAFDGGEHEWEAVRQSSIFKRLKRIEAEAGTLVPASRQLLEEIAKNHPQWEASEGDRDDFSVWHGKVRSGPRGHPERLKELPDDELVSEAFRLQQEEYFKESDVWRQFCLIEPQRAFAALKLNGKTGKWPFEGWQGLLTTIEKAPAGFYGDLAAYLVTVPREVFAQLIDRIAGWLAQLGEKIYESERPERFFDLWDRLAESVYGDTAASDRPAPERDDLDGEALNRPGGELVRALLTRTGKQRTNAGLPVEIEPRLTKAVSSDRHAGLLARVICCNHLCFLYRVDPTWTAKHVLPRMVWSHAEARPLWNAYAHSPPGPAGLFNAVKSDMLLAVASHLLNEHAINGLIGNLLQAAIWKKVGAEGAFQLDFADVKRILSASSEAARQNVAWQLNRLIQKNDSKWQTPGERWRNLIGPLINEIWPLDAKLRSPETSRRLVSVAVHSGDAFPEAVEMIVDLIVPYRIYQTGMLAEENGNLARTYPRMALKLMNALTDPEESPLPDDLRRLLHECEKADPTITTDPAYIRLDALLRQKSA